jgi:hypothetical protein
MLRQTAGYAILALLVASLSFAQTAPVNVATGVPPVIRFSGTLAVPAGRVPVTFGLYADQTGGEPLWLETLTVPVNEAGRYAVLLGTATALPTELFASGEAKWLGVRLEGQTEQPRVLLVSVPYALKASDAETIGGKPLSAFVLAGEKTGTAADGLTYLNPQALTTATKPLASGAGALPQGAGSPGFIGMFTDSVNLGNSVIFQSGSSIGVGTTTPAAPLHVAAAMTPAAYFDVYNNSLGALPVVYRAARGTPAAPTAVGTDDILGGLAVRGYGATGFTAGRGQVMFKAAENWTDTANGTYLQFTTTPAGSANFSERMRISSAGNVGIGTTTPAQLLSVAGTVESTTGGFKFPDGSMLTTATGAVGNPALYNTASGASALQNNTTGGYNTASGASALVSNTTASYNTASGAAALFSNTTGSQNTASGFQALFANTTGYDNTAIGVLALTANTTGFSNTANGVSSLALNTTGSQNTASGAWALHTNTIGLYNTAWGYLALSQNATGSSNTASGSGAIQANTTGDRNTANGANALWSNTTGSSNIAIGYAAGTNLTTGSNNIDIGHPGVAAESSTIRIGTPGTQTRTFIGGVRGVTTGATDAVAVVVDSNGQLGTISSSRRVKDDIADMAGASSGLMNLRPVTFHYKIDQNAASRTLQYGLIAEEVAEIYPGLVARSANGQIETVLYQFLPPMLLNEYQNQQRTIDTLRAQVAAADAQTRKLAEQVAALTRAVAALSDRRQ